MDGKLLVDVLPPDVYARFFRAEPPVRRRAGQFQRYRPYYAVEFLRDIAMTRLHLASDGGVEARVRSLANYFLVDVQTIKPVGGRERDSIVRQLEKTPREADIPCVRVMLERMDSSSGNRSIAPMPGPLATWVPCWTTRGSRARQSIGTPASKSCRA